MYYWFPFAKTQLTLNDDPYLSVTLTIFCAGCRFSCDECHSPYLQDPNNGEVKCTTYINQILDRHDGLIDSVCFCGGEWTLYEKPLLELVDTCRERKLKTILYTGCLYEDLSKDIKAKINIIIDGRYDNTKKQNKFPASSNQRVFVDGQEVNANLLPINQRKY